MQPDLPFTALLFIMYNRHWSAIMQFIILLFYHAFFPIIHDVNLVHFIVLKIDLLQLVHEFIILLIRLIMSLNLIQQFCIFPQVPMRASRFEAISLHIADVILFLLLFTQL